MNKKEKFEILQKLNQIYTYNDFLSEDFKEQFISDLDALKQKISSINLNESVKDEKSEPSSYSFTPISNPTIPPPPPNAPPPPKMSLKNKNSSSVFVPIPKTDSNQNELDNKKVIKKNNELSFKKVSSLLFPKITIEGENAKNDLSLPINQYLALKAIDNKLSLFNLFENHKKKYTGNFIDLANSLYELELKKYITFSKKEKIKEDYGFLKIEIFLEGAGLISEKDLDLAYKTQKEKKELFIGKTLSELKLVEPEIMKSSVKIQKWFPRMLNKASLIEKEIDKLTNTTVNNSIDNIVESEKIKENEIAKETISSIFNFVIPSFNNKGLEILKSPNNKSLAERLSIINGKMSIYEIYNRYESNFKNSQIAFLKFLIKLSKQGILTYKSKENTSIKPIWVKFGELLISLGQINSFQLNKVLDLKNNDIEFKDKYTGEILVENNFIDSDILNECLNIQKWFNEVLSEISYEAKFVDVVQSVLIENFKCSVEVGEFKKATFNEPLEEIVYIKYPISGKYNGFVYYISDRFFMQSLAQTISNSVGTGTKQDFDESSVGTVSTVIISNSLAKLSEMGLFSKADMAKILMEKEVKMDKEIIVAEKQTISLVPLNNQFGRFAIGFKLNKED